MPTKTTAKTTTTTFAFDANTQQVLDDLRDTMGATSKAEVVRRAVALLKLVQDEKAKGHQLAFLGDEDKIEGKLIVG